MQISIPVTASNQQNLHYQRKGQGANWTLPETMDLRTSFWGANYCTCQLLHFKNLHITNISATEEEKDGIL